MSGSKKICRRLLCLILSLLAVALLFTPIYATDTKTEKEVIVGGCLFGLKMQTKGVNVVGIDKVVSSQGASSPAYDAGLKISDNILTIDGIAVSSVGQVTDIIADSNGKTLSFGIIRKGAHKTLNVKPTKGSDGKYHIGIWIRDSAAGIGTVTYIDPKTLEFAGLGHGICDGATGELLPLSRGIVTDTELIGIIKGKSGKPGEIKGAFKGGKKGAVMQNTSSGVYGIYSALPNGVGERITVGTIDDAREGEATIRSAVSGEVKEYKIEIVKIDQKNKNGKNFTISITDPNLLKITGGIVQGMSGSPIIQNGKLVGAVTHVLINDPTSGYGIFIENMLNAS